MVYSSASSVGSLAEYARRFDSVEIDQWFWALPERRVAAEYAAATPTDFRFTIKLPNTLTLTHFYRKKGEAEPRPNPDFLSPTLFQDVLERLEPLHAKTGMLMLQFEYLNKQKMPSSAALLDKLSRFIDAAPRVLPLGIELRNPHWINGSYFDLLEEKRLSHVFLQGYYMPPVMETWARYAERLHGAVVLRLHGPDREGMERQSGERWDRIIAPKDEELDRLVAMINDMRGRSLTVYLNINNHYEGSAPLTIERLRERGLA